MSRSPSPRPGGWSSPGLSTPYDGSGANGSSSHNVTWASAQARSAEVKSNSGFNPRGQGFFTKHFRRISTSLPMSYGDKEKVGRGRYQNNKFMQFLNRIAWNIWRLRRSLGVVLFIVFSIIMFYVTRKSIEDPQSPAANGSSPASNLQTIHHWRRRQQVRRHTRCESRRRCHGMEGSS